ncbi:MAG TPA: DUF3999 domain-containing protein [Burkholderiales bacterium]|nr:DUF3999 domain-containing protein [Burkholderiales bacterium]
MRRFTPFLLLMPALAAAERPQDFAYGIPLAVDGREAFYQVEVPRALYEGVVRADLGDVRVFNAAGEVVPHALRPRVTATKTPPPVEATLFPLRTDAPAGIEGLDLRVEKSGDRTVVSLRTRDGKPAPGTKLVGYVVDVSGLDAIARAVVLELPANVDNVTTRVTLEASDDLRQWTTLASGASVLRLVAGGERLEQLRIELPARKAKYLRLTWPGRGMPLELAGIAVEPGETIVEAPRQWHEVPGTAVKDKPGEFEFDLGGQLPIDRLRVALPQPNTVAVIEVLARAKPADPWRPVTRTTVYRLNREGEELKSPDIATGGTADRYWLVKVDPRGGGIGGGPLALGVGWVPHRLVFAARGAAPFQLAYGSRDAKPAAYAIATLVPGYKDEATLDVRSVQPGAGSPAVAIGAAQTSPPQPLGGEQATREQIEWKRWTLWGSLVLGVALLGLMALRLGRQMSKPPEPPES